jgi:hypothetical protein
MMRSLFRPVIHREFWKLHRLGFWFSCCIHSQVRVSSGSLR